MKGLPLLVSAALVSACAGPDVVSARTDASSYALIVAQDGTVLSSESENADPETTRFPVYSVAKPMTVAAALRLTEARRLDPVRDVREFAPSLKPLPAPVTALQLATHSAGIRHYRGEEAHDECASIEASIGRFVHDPLLFTPGERQGYSSHGFVALSAVVEAASGLGYAEAMTKLVFEPMGIEPRLAPDGMALSCKFGAGGYLASAHDVATFAHRLFDPEFLSVRSQSMLLRGGDTYAARGSGNLGTARFWVRPGDRKVVVLLAKGVSAERMAALERRFDALTGE